MNIDEDYQKIMNLLEANELELARTLLNVVIPRELAQPVFGDPLYALLSDEQLVNVISCRMEHLGALGGSSIKTRNGTFEFSYNTHERKIQLQLPGCLGMIFYVLRDNDKSRRRRRVILDVSLL